jgi:hypothetical protein
VPTRRGFASDQAFFEDYGPGRRRQILEFVEVQIPASEAGEHQQAPAGEPS